MLSFTASLGESMQNTNTELVLRGAGPVSEGQGLNLICSLGLHFTEKNLELGGALLLEEHTHTHNVCPQKSSVKNY